MAATALSIIAANAPLASAAAAIVEGRKPNGQIFPIAGRALQIGVAQPQAPVTAALPSEILAFDQPRRPNKHALKYGAVDIPQPDRVHSFAIETRLAAKAIAEAGPRTGFLRGDISRMILHSCIGAPKSIMAFEGGGPRMEPRDDHERRFNAEGFKLADLIGVLDDGGIVWGRDFVVKGHPGPDVFELLFENEVLAARAHVMWTSKLRSST